MLWVKDRLILNDKEMQALMKCIEDMRQALFEAGASEEDAKEILKNSKVYTDDGQEIKFQ